MTAMAQPSVKVTMNMPPDVYEAAKEAAHQRRESLTAYIVQAVQKALGASDQALEAALKRK